MSDDQNPVTSATPIHVRFDAKYGNSVPTDKPYQFRIIRDPARSLWLETDSGLKQLYPQKDPDLSWLEVTMISDAETQPTAAPNGTAPSEREEPA